MAVAGEATYLRRFAGKFVEIVAAGIGTAVSGYVVAYVTGHLSWFMPAAVKPAAPAPQAISTPVEPKQAVASTEPKKTIEATVRAALASHDVTESVPPAATPQRPAPAAPIATAVATTPATTVAPPLATTEIKTVPVTAAAESPLPTQPDGWPSDPALMSSTGPVVNSGRMLPPQPPPVNGNLLTALKHFF